MDQRKGGRIMVNLFSEKAKSDFRERFWKKVKKGAPEDCWNWNGATSRGYGIMSTRHNHAPAKAYRVSWYLHFGPIPEGMVIRHKCDNPACVNPSHLEIGSQKDNVQDTVARGRLNPLSSLNLRPGHKGYYGAGPLSRKENCNG